MSNYKESHFLALQDHIAEGSKRELTPEERDYENLLFATVGIVRKEGRIAAREWLIADQECSRFVAERIVAEAMNLFYTDDNVQKEAWRNLIFEKVYAAITDWERTFISHDDDGSRQCSAKAKDFEALAKLVKEAAVLKRLDQADDRRPQSVSNTQMNIYMTDARRLEMPATDRQAIIRQPLIQQLPKREQKRLEMEVGMRAADIDEIMENSKRLADEFREE